MSDPVKNLQKKALEKAYKKDAKKGEYPKIEEGRLSFTEFCEEWKPFPTDKVNKNIEKKRKSTDPITRAQAKIQNAVKNYKTKSSIYM